MLGANGGPRVNVLAVTIAFSLMAKQNGWCLNNLISAAVFQPTVVVSQL